MGTDLYVPGAFFILARVCPGCVLLECVKLAAVAAVVAMGTRVLFLYSHLLPKVEVVDVGRVLPPIRKSPKLHKQCLPYMHIRPLVWDRDQT